MMDASSTRALVVGVERFAAGDKWDLDGPATDARRFADWLLERGVPSENIRVFLSPLCSQPATNTSKFEVEPATESNLDRAIRQDLRYAKEEVLWIFWGGHGVVCTEGARRLFFADATVDDKRNLRVDSLLKLLRSDYFKNGLSTQILVIDSCAHLTERMGWAYDLPSTRYPVGKQSRTRRQFVLAAARSGEGALNLSNDKTGIFSREFLSELERADGSAWPPDMPGIATNLASRFQQLRSQGEVKQSPIFLSYRDWEENEHEIGTGESVADASPAPSKISIARLPITGKFLFGREAEMERLHEAWNSTQTNIVQIVAWGGVGKSALINHWLRGLRAIRHNGPGRVFGWSFYRQGAANQAATADEFVSTALAWFGDLHPADGSSWEKGERLAELIRAESTLLILDGLEPIQRPPGDAEGSLKDPAMQALLREIAVQNKGLCVISTRIPVNDIAEFEGISVERMDLDHLSRKAGAQLLTKLGVKGDADELERAVEEYGGHSLALNLLGRYLADAYEGRIGERHQIGGRLHEEQEQGAHAHRVIASYEDWFGKGPEIQILRLLGLFDRPAEEAVLARLRTVRPAIPDLTDILIKLSNPQWRAIVSKLRRTKLIAGRDPDSPGTLDSHPLIREYFAGKLRREYAVAWKRANNILYEYYRADKELPNTLQEMEPLLRAVVYGCNAGRHRDALHEIFFPRILRGPQSYAARQLGARGALLAVLGHFFEEGDWTRAIRPAEPDAQGVDAEDELQILTQVGLYLTATKGYSVDDIGRCYGRVEELCLELDRETLLYVALIAQWRHSLVTGALRDTYEIAQRVYSLAEKRREPALTVGACRALCDTTFFMGEFAKASEFARIGIQLWESGNCTDAVEEITSPAVTCYCFEALSLWHSSLPAEAWETSRKAVATAREVGDLHALAVALYFEAFLGHFDQNSAKVADSCDELIDVSTRQSFAFWLAGARVLKGWSDVLEGDHDSGLSLLCKGIDDWTNTGARLIMPYWLAINAEAHLVRGEFQAAHTCLDRSSTFAQATGEFWWMSGSAQVRGDVLVRQEENPDRVRAAYAEAAFIAEKQGSRAMRQRAESRLSNCHP